MHENQFGNSSEMRFRTISELIYDDTNAVKIGA